MKIVLHGVAGTILMLGSPALAQEAVPIELGDNGSGNACENGNWMIVGFESREQCIATFGEPDVKPDRPGSGSIDLKSKGQQCFPASRVNQC